MWSAIGGQEKAQEVNKEIAKYVDVMIGNEGRLYSMPRI